MAKFRVLRTVYEYVDVDAVSEEDAIHIAMHLVPDADYHLGDVFYDVEQENFS